MGKISLKLNYKRNVLKIIEKNRKVLIFITGLYRWYPKLNIHSIKTTKKLKEKEFIPM